MSNGKVAELMEEQERLQIKIVELNKKMHTLIEENRTLAEENQSLRAKGGQAASKGLAIPKRTQPLSSSVFSGLAGESPNFHSFFGATAQDRESVRPSFA